MNKSNKLVLQSKQQMADDGKPSPADADALAFTLARAVGVVKPQPTSPPCPPPAPPRMG